MPRADYVPRAMLGNHRRPASGEIDRNRDMVVNDQPSAVETLGCRHPRSGLTRHKVSDRARFHLCSRRKSGRLGSSFTHGSLSSVHIAASGGKVLGSSSDATVTSIHSELTSSWISKGVPQHEANERNLSAYKTLRSSPLRTSIALLGTLHQVTYGAALARRQSSQWQSLPCFGLTCRR